MRFLPTSFLKIGTLVSVLLFFFLAGTEGASAAINKPTNFLGMVAYYTFDGPDIITNFQDKSGTGNHASSSGQVATTTTLGKIGQALFLDGANDRLSTSGDYIGINDITVTAWIKIDSFGGSNLGNIITNGNFILRVRGSTASLDYRARNNTVSVSANNSIATSTWHFIALTRTGATVNFYVDGALSGGANQTNEAPLAGSANVQIGNRIGDDQGFHGALDDLRVYTRVLTAGEIAVMYNSGKATVKSGTLTVGKTKSPGTLSDGLVGHWTFDGKDLVPNVRDLSGQENHGTISGQPATTTAPGKIGQALLFDGVNDVVNLSANPISNYANPNSICAWGKGSTGRIINVAADANNGVNMGYNSPKLIVAYSSAGVDYGKSSSADIPLSQWAHFCYTWDGSAIALYVNGASAALGTNATFGAQTGNKIGQRGSFGGANLNGATDDIRVYNRALSASEVLQLYNMGR